MSGYLNQSSYMNFKVLIRYIEEVLKEMEKVKSKTGDPVVLSLLSAVEQHRAYIENMVNMLDGKIEWVPPQYTQCMFGRTYYSIDETRLGKAYGDAVLTQFQKIGETHREFHSIAEEIMNRLQQGKDSNVNTLIFDLATKSRMLVDDCKRFILLQQKTVSQT